MTATRLAPAIVALAALVLAACSGGGDSSGGPGTPTLSLEFTRNAGSADRSFKAVVWMDNGAGGVQALSAPPTLALSRGTPSAFTPRGDGKQEATITPDGSGSGEYRVTASANGQSVTHTAIVMGEVAAGWGQPMAIEGLVNTGGTQDSLAVSPDGEWLFLQYYPVSISCLLFGDETRAECRNALGPVVAPERPGMPGANRVSGAGIVHHGCPSLGLDPAPFPVPPLAMYGFRRQADGSYREPFVFSFTGSDGCIAPFGASAHANGDGSYRLFVSFDDPRLAGSGNNFPRVYDFDIAPGQAQTLGHASIASGSLQITDFALRQAAIAGADVWRGNPHVHYAGGTPSLLFYDDENPSRADADRFIFVSQRTGNAWAAPVELNFAPFNQTGFGNTQPWFDGTRMILREGLTLLSFGYSGGPLGSASSWSGPSVLLAPQLPTPIGGVCVVGEPTVASIGGREQLFFVYGILQPDGTTINLRAGSVRQSP